jgi:hypothetical protein
MMAEGRLDIHLSHQFPIPGRRFARGQRRAFDVPEKLPASFMALALLIILGCLSAPQVRADVYQYTGNAFTSDIGGSSFLGDAITGEFTYNLGALPVDTTTDVSGSVFSFTAGPVTIDQIGAAIFVFQVTTDVDGTIVGWAIDVASSDRNEEIFSYDPGSAGTGDEVDIYAPSERADNATSPGTWTNLSVPEPTSLAVLGVALVGVHTVRRRRGRGGLMNHPPTVLQSGA